MQAFQIIAIVVSLALTAVAVVLSVKAVRSMVGVIRTGTKAMPRTANPTGRTVTMVKETLLHTRMLQWTVVGVMHWFVYLAFIVLSAAVFTAFFQLFSPDFQLPLIGHFFLYEWVGEFLGVLGTIGIVYLIYYRQKHHPRREGRDSRFYRSTMWQAYFVEAFVLLEGSAILFIRGAEYNLGRLEGDDRFTRFHFPVSSFFGDVLFPAGAGSEGALETAIIAIAMGKIVLAMVWLIVLGRNLTMGVAWHRFTAWPNIWFKREPSGRTALGAMKPLTIEGRRVGLDDIEELDEESVLGVGRLEDFSWKGILDFTTCTECGRCQSQCPAWNTEKPLNPKLLITAMRDATYARSDYTRAVKAGGEGAGATLLEGNDVLTLEAERPLVGETADDEWFYNPPSGAAVIDAEVLWNCTSCGACVQQCPVDIEHVDHIMDMRRYQVLVESNFPAQLNGLFKGLENKGNPWNMSTTARLDWTKGLDFDVKVVGEDVESLDEVDWLFWVGCAGAYEDRAKKTTRAVAELLDMAGVSFAVLGNGETCTGDPARRAGNEFVFQGLAQQNAEVLTESKAKKVVSACAHCFNTLKNEYAEFGVELEVVHHTQLLNRLVRDGKLTPVNEGPGAHKRSITYHDPCFIGRHNGVYTPPRELLSILPGAEYVEMERSSERSFCCGAGGAQMWMEEKTGTRINMNRTAEAVGTGADQIAVGCPFCRIMLSDGLTMQQSNEEAREEVEVLDVAQMLLASVKGEMATKLAPGAAEAAGSSQAPKASAAPAAEQPAADDTSEETRAEPSPEDDTQTVDPDNTVTDTADAGPLAKASGGSSLFDDPEAQTDGETATEDKSVPEEAAAAKPASSGGSLFDLGGDAEDATAGSAESAEPETAKASASDTAESESESGSESGSSGSLFDIEGDAGEQSAEEPPTTGAEAPAEVAEPDEPDEPAAPAATGSAASAPSSDIPEGGSLFDITADETPAAAAAPAATEDESSPEPEVADEADQSDETDETGTSPEAPAAEPAEPAASGTVSTPSSSIPEGGSLFDIVTDEAPADERPAPAPADSADDADEPAVGEKEVEADVVESSDTPVADDSTDETTEPAAAQAEEKATEADVVESSDTSTSDAVAEPPEAPEADTSTTSDAQAAPTESVSAGVAPVARRGGRRPGTGGSMFDFAAPAGTVEAGPDDTGTETADEPAAAAPPASPSSGRDPASSMFDFASRRAEPKAAEPAQPTQEPEPEPEPKPEPEAPTSALSAGASVSAAATAAASSSGGETPAPSEPDQQGEPTAEAAQDEAADQPDEAAEQQSDTEAEVTDAQGDGVPATDDETTDATPAAAPEAEAKPPSGGEAHQPRTDVEIGEGSLFDL